MAVEAEQTLNRLRLEIEGPMVAAKEQGPRRPSK